MSVPYAIDFTQPFEDAFSSLVNFLPKLLGGLVILAIGYIVAKVLGNLIGKLLNKVGFNNWMDRAGVSGILQRSGTGLTASDVLGKVVFWFVFLISFTMFASALGVPEISNFMSDMLGYIPRIFAAIVILCLAALFANFIAAIIRGATGNETLAKVGRYAILVYAAFAALTQLGIAVQMTGNTLLIILGGVALALGLAFGLGGKEMAADALQRMSERASGLGSGAQGLGGEHNGRHGQPQPQPGQQQTGQPGPQTGQQTGQQPMQGQAAPQSDWSQASTGYTGGPRHS